MLGLPFFIFNTLWNGLGVIKNKLTNLEKGQGLHLFLNICSRVFIFSILYFSIVDLDFSHFMTNIKTHLIGFFISFSISGLITSFILNKFKYSKYLIIRIFQKFVIYSLLFLIVGSFISETIYCDPTDETEKSKNNDNNESSNSEGVENNNYNNNNTTNNSEVVENNNYNNNKTNNTQIASLDISNNGNGEQYIAKIDKQTADNALNNSIKVGKAIGEELGLTVGVGSATGGAVSAAIKATSGMPIGRRGAIIAGTAVVTAASTRVGIAIGNSIVKNSNLFNNSNNNSPDEDTIPSPDGSMINSVLEKGDLTEISPFPLPLTPVGM